jgi:quercetin dioxygenase-like cupin family protein
MARLERLAWTSDERPSVASVERRLREERVAPAAWSNGPHDRYAQHSHPYTKLLMCAAGSITFTIDDHDVELRPGDGFVLTPGTPHSAVVGPAGCTCVEGHR